LLRVFPTTKVIDRRAVPSHGYRAVHVVVNVEGRPIEVQVRTSLQHLWAELSEKVSDIINPAIKYGSGEGLLGLNKVSYAIAQIEKLELMALSYPASSEAVRNARKVMLRSLESAITNVAQMRKAKNDISD
jgi:Region found in RelA / SpoT proteins